MLVDYGGEYRKTNALDPKSCWLMLIWYKRTFSAVFAKFLNNHTFLQGWYVPSIIGLSPRYQVGEQWTC